MKLSYVIINSHVQMSVERHLLIITKYQIWVYYLSFRTILNTVSRIILTVDHLRQSYININKISTLHRNRQYDLCNHCTIYNGAHTFLHHFLSFSFTQTLQVQKTEFKRLLKSITLLDTIAGDYNSTLDIYNRVSIAIVRQRV